MYNLKYGTNEPIYKTNRLIEVENRQAWQGRGMDWEFGVGKYILLHLEQINYKVLMYTTGN